jgi:DUF1009 family protein
VKKIGMITGIGSFPKIFLEKAREKGIIVYPLALFDSVDEEIKKNKNYRLFNIGQIGKFIGFFLKEEIKEVIMLGKVEKEEIFKDIEKDSIYNLVMEKAPNKKDETLLMSVVAILKLNGIKILPQNYLLEEYMTVEGCYTKTNSLPEDEKTIKIGIEGAKALTKIDAAQTVVVKDGSIIALEGIEGTDKTIERAGNLAGKGCIIVKMARPKQDMRLDIPAIGINTLIKAKEIGAKGLVVEANKMIFLEKDKVIEYANANNLFIKAIKA